MRTVFEVPGSMFALVTFCCLMLTNGQEKPMRVAVVESIPYVIQDPVSGKATGMMIDILEELARRYQLKYELTFAADGKHGAKVGPQESSWNGMVGMLVRKQADVAFTPLTINFARKEVIDFSQPLFTNGIVMLIKKPNPGEKIKILKMSDLLIKTDQDEITYGAIDGGSTMQFFQDSMYDIYEEMGRNMAKRLTKTPKTYTEAVKQVKSGRFVFLGERDLVEYHTGKECDLMVVGNQINTISHALGYPKHSLFMEKLDRQIAALIQDGTWERLKSKWWQDKCGKPHICMCSEQPGSWNEEKKKYEVSTQYETGSGTINAGTVLFVIFAATQVLTQLS